MPSQTGDVLRVPKLHENTAVIPIGQYAVLKYLYLYIPVNLGVVTHFLLVINDMNKAGLTYGLV